MKAKYLSLRVSATDAGRAERLGVEAVEAGALGWEDQQGEGGAFELVLYLTEKVLTVVRAALASLLGEGDWIGEVVEVPDVDWSTAWQSGFEAVEISPRLLVRPSFVAHESRLGQHCLVIDPGQAFGTGAHSSTWLALEALDALGPDALQGRAVLDVGCGTGVLSLAALALGASSALGFDIDSLAAEAARKNALINGLSENADFFTGPIESVRAAPSFDGILANMLRREMLPLFPALAERLAPGGWAIFSGLLDTDLPQVEPALEELGFSIESRRERVDSNSDRWVALCARQN